MLSNGREYSNKELKFISKSLPKFSNGLNVSGNLDEDKQGGFYKNYFRVNNWYISSYVGDSTYSNPCKQIELDLDEATTRIDQIHFQKYDLVFNHTVLEHIKNPFQAFQNLEFLLAPNGILISVVPFIYKFHYSNGDFGDYWRYTPHSLELLHKKFGLFLSQIKVGPLKGYEKYIITVASRSIEYKNSDIVDKKFLEWNNTLGENSLTSLTNNLIHKVSDLIKLKIVRRS